MLFCTPFIRGSKVVHRKNLGAYYLQAALKDVGINSDCLTLNQRCGIKGFADAILSCRCNLVGFSVFDENLELVIRISTILKSNNKDIRIVCGGPSVIGPLANLIHSKYGNLIDYFIEGPAEQSLPKLIGDIQKGVTEHKDISGLYYLSNNKIISIPCSQGAIDFDKFSSPYLGHIIPEYEYPYLGLISSRGCCYRCTYCNFSFSGRWPVHFYNEDRFVDELSLLSASIKNYHDIDYLYIWDDNFLLNAERAKRMLRKIIYLNLGLKLWCETRVDKADKALLKLMKDAGIVSINVGLESASCKVLKTIKKARTGHVSKVGYAPERKFLNNILKVRRWAEDLDITFSVSIIVGLPCERYEDALKTIRFLKKLRPDYYSHNILKLYSGTQLSRNFEKYGYVIIDAFDKDIPIACHTIKYPYNVGDVPPLPSRFVSEEIPLLTGRNIDALRRNHGFVDKGFTVITGKMRGADCIDSYDNEYFDQTYCAFGVSTRNRFFDAPPFINHGNLKQLEAMSPLDGKHDRKFFYYDIPYSKLNTFMNDACLGLSLNPNTNRFATLAYCYVLIRADDTIDEELLHSDARSLLCGGRIKLPDNLLNLQFRGYYILDSCKWSTCCPAMGKDRIFVSKDNIYRTCTSGPELESLCGGVGASIEQLRRIARALYDRRKCRTCIAFGRCAQCFAVDADRESSYCNGMRSGIDRTGIQDLLNLLTYNFLDPFRKRALHGDNYLFCRPYINDRHKNVLLWLVSLDMHRVLIINDSNASFFINLRRLEFEIIESIMSEVADDKIIRHIVLKYSLTSSQANKHVMQSHDIIASCLR